MFHFRGILLVIFFVLGWACKNSPPTSTDRDDPLSFPNAVRLTDEKDDILPAWSPTGEKIAFERRGNIYVLNVETSTFTLMTEGYSPSWSLDGQLIAFVRGGELYAVRDIPERPVEKISLGAIASRVSGLDWGSGGWLAYFQPGDSLEADRLLKVFNVHSRTTQYIQHMDLGYAELPDWSRDGSQLVFSSMKQGICLYNRNTEIVQSIVYWGSPGKACFFSTVDSTFVLFVEMGYMYRINPDGTDRTLVYGGNFHPGSMDYSYTTGRLTFSYSGIWMMDFPPEEE
jgi:hypothetical protein